MRDRGTARLVRACGHRFRASRRIAFPCRVRAPRNGVRSPLGVLFGIYGRTSATFAEALERLVAALAESFEAEHCDEGNAGYGIAKGVAA